MSGTTLHARNTNCISTVALVLGILSKLVCSGCGDSAPTLSSIAITPATGSVPKGLTDQMAAAGTFSDGRIRDVTSQVQWASEDPSSANISNNAGSNGLVSSLLQGSVVISASINGLSASTQIQVADPALLALTVNAASAAIALGADVQLIALGIYSDGSNQDLSGQVIWSSSDPRIATVSNDASSLGMLTALAAGAANITATLSHGLSAMRAFTIS